MSQAHPKILVLEEKPFCSRLLEGQPFELSCAGELKEGLARLAKEQVDLALLCFPLRDCECPGGLIQLRKAATEIPIVVLARTDEQDDELQALQLGVEDSVLNVAVNPDGLAGAVREALCRHRAQEEDRHARHLLEVLMDNIPDAIYFKDEQSRFRMISRAHAKISG